VAEKHIGVFSVAKITPVVEECKTFLTRRSFYFSILF
jgi:hypothetical protein